MVAASALVALLHLPVETIQSRFGGIPTGLPLPKLPDLSLDKVSALLPTTFTIAFLIGLESLLSAVAADAMAGTRHRSNMEIVAQGAANIASSMFGGLPAMTKALEASFKAANPNNRFELDCFNAGFTFESLLVAADAFKRAGSTDGPTLMKAVKETSIKDHVMIGGPIAFNDKGDNLNIASASVENIHQTPTVVFPADAATATPILPMPAWQGRK